MADQWIRKASLVVTSSTQVIDLSNLHFTFYSKNADELAPNTLYVRVYNVSRETASKISGAKPAGTPTSGPEFAEILLQAGYENGNYGIVFKGTIKQVATGRERNVDSFVEIWAADGDLWHNFSVLNTSVESGANPQGMLKTITGSQSPNGVAGLPFATDTNANIAGAVSGARATLRGRALFGMARDYVRDWEKTYGYRCSIQNGQLVATKITGYRPGEAVKISSTTGMVGVPEATNGGVNCTVLLNPKIQVGCLVQIDPADLNQITRQQQGLTYSLPIATVVTTAGIYRVLVCEIEGDSRGQAWYSHLTCLAVDTTAKDSAQSVKAAG